jgi:hypothetical protein
MALFFTHARSVRNVSRWANNWVRKEIGRKQPPPPGPASKAARTAGGSDERHKPTISQQQSTCPALFAFSSPYTAPRVYQLPKGGPMRAREGGVECTRVYGVGGRGCARPFSVMVRGSPRSILLPSDSRHPRNNLVSQRSGHLCNTS